MFAQNVQHKPLWLELSFRLSHVLIKLLFDDNVATLIPLSLH